MSDNMRADQPALPRIKKQLDKSIGFVAGDRAAACPEGIFTYTNG